MRLAHRVLWPALLSASIASAQVMPTPRDVRIPEAAAAEPRSEIVASRPDLADTVAIDPQFAQLRHELSQLRREMADQQRELQGLHACVAELALAAREGTGAHLAADMSMGSALSQPAQPAALLSGTSLAAPTPGSAAPDRQGFGDCG